MRCYFNEIPQHKGSYAFNYLNRCCIFWRVTTANTFSIFQFSNFCNSRMSSQKHDQCTSYESAGTFLIHFYSQSHGTENTAETKLCSKVQYAVPISCTRLLRFRKAYREKTAMKIQAFSVYLYRFICVYLRNSGLKIRNFSWRKLCCL